MERYIEYLLLTLISLPLVLSEYYNTPVKYFIVLILFLLSLLSILNLPKLSLVVPILVLPFYLTDPYVFILSIVLSLFTFYLNKYIQSIYIPLALSLLIVNLSYILIVFSIIVMIGIFYSIKLDLRGIVLSGIILLILSSLSLKYSYLSNFSNLAYFYLLFGIIGMIFENTRISRIKYTNYIKSGLLFLPFPILALIIGTPHAYYWWNVNSYAFKLSPLSLGLPGFYFPQINEVLGTYPLSHFLIYKLGNIGIYIYYFIFIYLSGIFSLFLFKKLNLSFNLFFSLIYEILSPYQDPLILIGYSLLPLVLYLTLSNVKSPIKYPLVMLTSVIGSSFYLFPLSFLILGSILDRKIWKSAIAIIFSNLFWIVPFLLTSASQLSIIKSNLFSLVIILILFITAYVESDKRFVISSIIGFTYMYLNLPYNQLFYPIAIISSFLALNSIKQLNFKKILTGILMFLFLFSIGISLVSFHSLSVPSFIEKDYKNLEKVPLSLVYWNDSFSKDSPLPFNNTVVNISNIKYIIYKGNVYNNSKYIGYPFYVQKVISPYVLLKGNWSEIPFNIIRINSSTFYYNYISKNISITKNNYVDLTSRLSYQFIAWNISTPSINEFEISVSGEFTGVSEVPQIFLGYGVNNTSNLDNLSSHIILINLGKHNLVFNDQKGVFSFIGYDVPFNSHYNFNVQLIFKNVSGRVQLYQEIINSTKYNVDVNSSLQWNQIKELGISLPIDSSLKLYNISYGLLNQYHVNSTYLEWDVEKVPSDLIFASNKVLTGFLKINSSKSLNISVEYSNGTIKPLNTPYLIGVSKIIFESYEKGNVSINSIYISNNSLKYVILGNQINKINKYNYTEDVILGGIRITFISNSSLKLYLYKFNNIEYIIDGKVIKNETIVLPPGKNIVIAKYYDEPLIFYLIYLSIILSVLVTIVSAISYLKSIRTKIFRRFKKLSKNF